MTWSASILTYFPELYPGPLRASILGRALEQGIWNISAHNIKEFGIGKHKTVDDTCYGGGTGMVVRPEVLGNAIESLFLPNNNKIIYLSPRGKLFNQTYAKELSEAKGLNIICGRFEGIDERVIKEYNICEVSIGDYILSSGDTAAMVLLDACVRLIPGVLANSEAIENESFATNGPMKGLLEHPHYTRPNNWKGRTVPEVLLSGNHSLIEKWRYEQALAKTKEVRPELLDRCKNLKED